MQAISSSDPKETDDKKCISCGACISVCPVKSRDYHSLAYKAVKVAFDLKCKEKKYPFTYFIGE